MSKQEDKSFKKGVIIAQLIGVVFLLLAGYVWAFGIPSFDNLEEQVAFCYNEGGMFFEPSRSTYNTALCYFDYENQWSAYAMDKVINKEWAEAVGKELGSYCFVCWDTGSCKRDTLTRIDNGTRRKTRC